MKATLLLCDYIQSADGKLNIIGAGWNVTTPGVVPSGIGLIFEIDWDRANEQQQWQLQLEDEDGNQVVLPTEMGSQPLIIADRFEVGRPPGMKPGVPLVFCAGINIGPLPLAPERRYQWRLTWNGETREDWILTFTTRTQQQQPGAAPPAPPGPSPTSF